MQILQDATSIQQALATQAGIIGVRVKLNLSPNRFYANLAGI
jgi:hypothetical protein